MIGAKCCLRRLCLNSSISSMKRVWNPLAVGQTFYLVPRPSWPSGSGFRRRTVWYRVIVFPCSARTVQGKIQHQTSTLVHFVATPTPLYTIFNIQNNSIIPYKAITVTRFWKFETVTPLSRFAWIIPEIRAPTSVTVTTFLLRPKHINNRNSSRRCSRALRIN